MIDRSTIIGRLCSKNEWDVSQSSTANATVCYAHPTMHTCHLVRKVATHGVRILLDYN